jgi:hypothetical protein
MDATTWARTCVAKLLAQQRREAAFELARWALVLRGER